MEIGEVLKGLRGERSLYSVAKAANMTITQLRKIEDGESKYPTFDSVDRIVGALGYELQIKKRKEGE